MRRRGRGGVLITDGLRYKNSYCGVACAGSWASDIALSLA